MAHFRGTVAGSSVGGASRLGSKVSGLETTAAGWGARIEVELWVHKDGRDMVSIDWRRLSGSNESRVVYRGPLNDVPEVKG